MNVLEANNDRWKDQRFLREAAGGSYFVAPPPIDLPHWRSCPHTWKSAYLKQVSNNWNRWRDWVLDDKMLDQMFDDAQH
jgi:hypothetical protein